MGRTWPGPDARAHRLVVRDLDTNRQKAHPGRWLRECREDGYRYFPLERLHVRLEPFPLGYQGSLAVSWTWRASSSAYSTITIPLFYHIGSLTGFRHQYQCVQEPFGVRKRQRELTNGGQC